MYAVYSFSEVDEDTFYPYCLKAYLKSTNEKNWTHI